MNVRFLNDDDKFLTIIPELIEVMARLIRKIRPNIVITHHPLKNAGIQNQHGITYQLTLHAMDYPTWTWPMPKGSRDTILR